MEGQAVEGKGASKEIHLGEKPPQSEDTPLPQNHKASPLLAQVFFGSDVEKKNLLSG